MLQLLLHKDHNNLLFGILEYWDIENEKRQNYREFINNITFINCL